jgi:hypothetical protein
MSVAATINLYDAASGGTVEIDASELGGATASFQQIQVCVDGSPLTMYVLGTTPS